MKHPKSNLDEMQEQKLLKVEHYGMWIAFWGLLIVMLVQIALGAGPKQLAGEWIVFMVLCVYITIGCLKNGIWSRNSTPSLKTNLLMSLLAGVIVGGIYAAVAIRNAYPIAGVVAGIFIFAFFTFGLCFIALTLTGEMYKNKRRKLDGENETEQQ